MNDLNWSHKDEWGMRGKDFLIVVSRHEEPLSEVFPELGIHRWCVYAYVYPAHPHFAAFDANGSMWQEATQDMPLHWCPSFFQAHYNGDGITSFQVGADYNHIGDAHYTHFSTKDQARSVFTDAVNLHAWLTERSAI